MRDVGAVRTNVPRTSTTHRDTSRAFTWEERQEVLEFVDRWAAMDGLHPGTTRLRRAVSDLTWMLAGTGMRVGEALALRWEHIDLTTGTTNVPGTMSRAARRTITLPAWLLTAMLERAPTDRH